MYTYKYVVRDKYRRYLYYKMQFYNIKLKYIISCQSLETFYKYNFYFKYLCILQERKYVFKNRCGLTFRGRWPIRFLKMSRGIFKKLVSVGVVSGFFRSMW